MDFVITVAQQKGGAGKTMLAASLAAVYAGSRRVALLDIDPQHSLSRWHKLRPATVPAITLSDLSGWRLATEIERLRRQHELLIVDSPPHVDTDARLAIRVAGLVLVPVQPSAPDLWAATATLDLARAERRTARLVLNRVTGTTLRAPVAAELARLDQTPLAARLGNRIGFANAFAQGLGVTEAAPRSLAANEMGALADEVAGLLA